MSVTTTSPPTSLVGTGTRGRVSEAAFRVAATAMATLVVIVLLGTIWFLVGEAWPPMRHYGPFTFFHTRWAPSEATATGTSPNPYGIVQFIYGTLVTSLIAMAIAVPVSIGVALFITQMAPRRLRGPLSATTDLLAAVPSVVYGFWALFALLPALRPIARFCDQRLAPIPLVGVFFRGPFFGFSYLAASIVLAIMILPIITALVREVFASVPDDQRDAALALGATRWEMIKVAVLPHGRDGILGASFLGLARALGETIAVTMVIGNNVLGISTSILGQGATLASVIANEFTEANQPYHLRSLFVVALWLLIITLLVNALGRLIVNRRGRIVGGTL